MEIIVGDKLINAKDRKVGDLSSGLPDVAGSVQLLMQPTKALLVQKQQINGYTQEISNEVATKAGVQPFTAQQLKLQPEGHRAWKWFSVWCLKNVDLKPNEAFVIKGIRYKIMAKDPWSDYGFFRYDVIEEYQDVADQSHSD